MKFYIKRKCTVNGKLISRRDKYVDLEYEDAKPWIRRGCLMRSRDQEVPKQEAPKTKKIKLKKKEVGNVKQN